MSVLRDDACTYESSVSNEQTTNFCGTVRCMGTVVALESDNGDVTDDSAQNHTQMEERMRAVALTVSRH
jgi:hypothetical protein